MHAQSGGNNIFFKLWKLSKSSVILSPTTKFSVSSVPFTNPNLPLPSPLPKPTVKPYP